MELRQYVEMLRRHRWTIAQAVVLVAVVAGVVSMLRTPAYEATAKVLLRPNDASEQINPENVSVGPNADRIVSAQVDIIESRPVLAAAAKTLNDVGVERLGEQVSVRKSATNDVVGISARSTDPTEARDMANAVAKAYIENRRQFAVANLQKASDEIGAKLTDLQQQIARYDAQIGDGGLQSPAGPRPQQPAEAPTPPESREGMRAARYAAAVQYETLYARQQELLVEMSLKRGEAELISEADTPRSPVSPKPLRDAVLGGFVGLLLGLGYSFLREQLDDRVRSRDELERLTGLPVLADVPFDEELARRPNTLVAESQPLGPVAEAVRSLRTSLQFLGVDSPIRRLVVTSPGPEAGKSTLAANLATAYAHAGYVTVLVSGDLRRPRVEDIFDVPKGRGFTGLIAELSGDMRPSGVSVGGPINGNGSGNGNGAVGSGASGNGHPHAAPVASVTPEQRDTKIADYLVATTVPNLFVLPSGSRPPNPAELLSSRRTDEVLSALGESADVVIIDAPPLLAVTDPAVLASKADGVVLVAALDETHRVTAQRAKAALDIPHVRVLGLVLNKVDPSSGGGYGYYGYYGEDSKPAKAGKQAKSSKSPKDRSAARPSRRQAKTSA